MSIMYGFGLLDFDKEQYEIVKEEKLEDCSEAKRDLSMCNMRAREALLSALPKNEYSEVKSFQTSYEIWKALESTFEGDDHVKRMDYKIGYVHFKMIK